MPYTPGTTLFETSMSADTTGPVVATSTEDVTVRLYFGGSIRDATENATLEVSAFIDGARVGGVSSLTPGISLEGSVAFAMRAHQEYRIEAVQKNRNATTRDTWIKGKIVIA